MGHVQLIVADNGIGICRSVTNHLRGAARSSQQEHIVGEQEKHVLRSVFDSGVLVKKGRESLGLQLVRRVIDLYGGALWCRSGISDYQYLAGRRGALLLRVNDEPFVELPGAIVALYVHCPTEWRREICQTHSTSSVTA